MTEANATNPHEGPGKGRAFFDRAKTVAATGNYDYAIECFVSGLAAWPDTVDEGHGPLRLVSMQRKQAGGKKAGMMETVKFPATGKDAVKAMLNAERLLSKDPGNIEHTLSEAFAHERAADTLLKLDRDEEALREYALALGRAQEVCDNDPSVGVAHEIIVVVNRKLGEWWLGRSTGAGSEEARRAEGHLRAALEGLGQMESRAMTAQHDDVDREAIAGLLERAARVGD